jgi:hypothetical protein
MKLHDKNVFSENELYYQSLSIAQASGVYYINNQENEYQNFQISSMFSSHWIRILEIRVEHHSKGS